MSVWEGNVELREEFAHHLAKLAVHQHRVEAILSLQNYYEDDWEEFLLDWERYVGSPFLERTAKQKRLDILLKEETWT